MSTPEVQPPSVQKIERVEIQRPSIGEQRERTRRAVHSKCTPRMLNPWDEQEVAESYHIRRLA